MSMLKRLVRAGSVGASVFFAQGCFLISRNDLFDWGACFDTGYGWDTSRPRCDDTGASDTGLSGADAGTADTVDSCDWYDLGLCFEFTNQSGVETWCYDLGATYDLDTTYAANGCDFANQGTCDGVTGGDFGSLTATVYYYDEFSNDPEAACNDAGGTYAP